MGKVYYDMGFLATAEVVECSSTEIIGQYVGQTGPKTQKVLENALGKVLFIDEAYRLADGHFAKEAMDEIVACLTNPKFAQKLVVILAGYDDDINRLMSMNPGLTSRFPETVTFKHLSPNECLSLLASILRRRRQLNTTVLQDIPPKLEGKLTSHLEILIKLPAWGNARDVQSLAKDIFKKAISSARPPIQGLILTEDIVIEAVDHMVSERSHRARSKPFDMSSLIRDIPQPTPKPLAGNSPPATSTNTVANCQHAQEQTPQTNEMSTSDVKPVAGDEMHSERDSGVSDIVWEQLLKDKQAAETRAKDEDRLLQRYDELKSNKEAEEQEDPGIESIDAAVEQDVTTDDDDYARRMHEQARLDHIQALEKKRRELEDLEKKRKAMEEARKLQVKIQEKLRKTGVCPAGFRWFKQSGGYRCGGGSHFVSDGQLDQM